MVDGWEPRSTANSLAPLAAWRVHATAAELYERTGHSDAVVHHHDLSRVTILQLAQSLPVEEPLRHTFLAVLAVAKVLGDAERISRSPYDGSARCVACPPWPSTLLFILPPSINLRTAALPSCARPQFRPGTS